MSSFQRLVRFVATDRKIYYGDAILDAGLVNIAKSTRANVIEGNILSLYNVTEKSVVSLQAIRGTVSELKLMYTRKYVNF